MRLSLVGLLFAIPAAAAPPEIVSPRVISTRPHDTSAYTQGLLLHAGLLYESAGGYDSNPYGPSTLRQVNPLNGRVLRSVELPKDAGTRDGSYFAEGLARVGNRLIQLTWLENTAFKWDPTDFTLVGRHTYRGQGWGLCYDGSRLVMSNGSATLAFRDPADFSLIGQVKVTMENESGSLKPVRQLNELECVGSLVYANIYNTDWIVEIDSATGRVQRRIDASNLLTKAEWEAGADVLNGIAHDTATGHFLITGKLWPWLFEVSFDSSATDAGAAVDGDPTAGGPAAPDLESGGCTAGMAWSTALLLAALLLAALRRLRR
jgi:glutaminyl-peptide cyclotransferase